MYVDDGKAIVRKLELGSRYNVENKCFEVRKENRELDELEEISRESLTDSWA